MLPESFTPQFVRQLELLNIRSKRAFLGSRQGGHLSLKRGHGLEFSDYRKYELGDHPRSIDWGVYARSERLYVKRFQEEQDLSVLIVLDTSASMNTPEGEKWQRAKEICLSLAYVALMQQDSVTLAGLGKKPGPVYHGMKAVHHIADSLLNIGTSGKIDLQREVILAASRVRFPGVAIFVSDFLMPFEEIQKAFMVLRAKNLDITAIQILGENDIQPFSGESFFVAVDSESEDEVNISYTPEIQDQYNKYMEEHWRKLSAYFKDNGINAIQLNSMSPISDLVVNKLSKVGLLS